MAYYNTVCGCENQNVPQQSGEMVGDIKLYMLKKTCCKNKNKENNDDCSLLRDPRSSGLRTAKTLHGLFLNLKHCVYKNLHLFAVEITKKNKKAPLLVTC
ncbi:hypothetical protein AMECASPLE_000344 [Ameca splendens]|uniref:Uncharacterized protein n=1 Tax=Ameca splendens TaxID=208324 RepID=A0ABV0XLQ1_9TELE